MEDLISRQELSNLLVVAQDEDFITLEEYDKFWDLVSRVPSVQSERKKGKWILTEDDNYEYCTCSECGYQNGENWMNGSDIPFCAMCGAEMTGVKDD